MKKCKVRVITAGMLAVVTAMALPSSALAGSPEFAYSAEKWAALRDDVLEYEEIADLVHEYNNTVIQNQISYQKERDKTSDDLADEYYDMADQIAGNIEYPDSDDSNYGSRMAAALNSEIQAREMMERGDESTDDAETLKLGYDQTEAGLVKQAQGEMISYYARMLDVENAKNRKVQAEASLASEQSRLAAGMSTQAKILSAQESVASADASILSAQSTLDKTKEELCLMLGWTYGADVTIGELPEPDIQAIDTIDVNADIQKALDNNYSLKKTVKQLSHARSESVTATLTQTQKNQREAISNSVKNSYDSLVLARSSYDQALQAQELQQNSLDTASRKLQAGMITRKAFEDQQTAYETARITAESKKLSLLQAMVDYQWSVDGLASAS